jgi:hypothetical protein
MAITLDGTTGTTTPALTNSALTSGRVTYAGTSGVLQDSANLTFDGSSLTVNTVKVGVGAGATSNLAIGANTLTSASIGANNIAIGSGAAQNSTGIQITTIGQGAAPNTTGNNSVYIGQTCATTATSGTYNVIIGQAACGGAVGVALTSGGQNTVIGGSANVSSATAVGQIVLGFSLAGQADNNVTIGNNAGKIYNAYTVNATWTQTSDGRLKTNIIDDSLGLSFINRLRPVTFNWKPSNEIDPSLPYYNETNQRNTTTVIHGLIAQEVKAALDAEGCSTFNGWDAGNEDTIQAISREMFISPLIKAIQELTARVAALESK